MELIEVLKKQNKTPLCPGATDTPSQGCESAEQFDTPPTLTHHNYAVCACDGGEFSTSLNQAVWDILHLTPTHLDIHQAPVRI